MNGVEAVALVVLGVWFVGSIALVPISMHEAKVTTTFLKSVRQQLTPAVAASLRRGTASTGAIIDQIKDDAITPVPDQWRLRRVPSIGEMAKVRRTSTLRLYHQEVRARRHMVQATWAAALALYGAVVGVGAPYWLKAVGELWRRDGGSLESSTDVLWLLASVFVWVLLPELVLFAPIVGESWVRTYTRRCETMLSHLEALIERKGSAEQYLG